jgi:hypothetical protein
MATEDLSKKTEEKMKEAPSPKQPEENKVKFLVWFTGALNRFHGVKAHHMSAIRAYFIGRGLGDPDKRSAYDEGLIKFGYPKKSIKK